MSPNLNSSKHLQKSERMYAYLELLQHLKLAHYLIITETMT